MIRRSTAGAVLLSGLLAAGLGGAALAQDEGDLVLSTGESIKLPQASKSEIADSILDQALTLRLALHAAR